MNYHNSVNLGISYSVFLFNQTKHFLHKTSSRRKKTLLKIQDQVEKEITVSNNKWPVA